MAKMFGEAGNLADFVKNYEIEKVATEKQLKLLEKMHLSLKQHTKDDYEQIINMFQIYEKRLVKLELHKTAIT